MNKLTTHTHIQGKNYMAPAIRIVNIQQTLMQNGTGATHPDVSREYRSDWSDD